MSDSFVTHIGCNSPGASIPWDFPSENTGMGCHFCLLGIFLNQGLNLHLLCLLHCRWIFYCWAIGEAHKVGIQVEKSQKQKSKCFKRMKYVWEYYVIPLSSLIGTFAPLVPSLPREFWLMDHIGLRVVHIYINKFNACYKQRLYMSLWG